MKTKTSTIRVKLVWTLLTSAGMSSICMLFLCVLMILASTSMAFAIFFSRHIFAFIILFLIIFSILTITFFLLLIRGKVKYLEDITKTLDEISEGNLDIHIPVKTNDELGRMAQTVNDMASKLKNSIEEERKAEKSKNDMITNISHDLRTPLTSILGYLELIANMNYIEEDKLKKYSNTALGQCKDLKVLIDELFEFSKLSSSGVVISKTRISIGELLEQVTLGFIPAFEKAGMEYRLCFPKDKITLEADPILLTRVFDNLIKNAVSYGQEGKYLDIELARENNEAVIGIINYGRPISESDLPFIFERFYRADKARSGQAGGSGIGLAIVKNIVELHNGSVKASSDDEKTVFEVRLNIDAALQ